jgi:hypothetical protein
MDRSGRRVFVACANGCLDVVDADNGFVFQVLKSGLGRSGVVFDRAKVRGEPGEAPGRHGSLSPRPTARSRPNG